VIAWLRPALAIAHRLNGHSQECPPNPQSGAASEKKHCVIAFLKAAIACHQRLGSKIKRVMTNTSLGEMDLRAFRISLRICFCIFLLRQHFRAAYINVVRKRFLHVQLQEPEKCDGKALRARGRFQRYPYRNPRRRLGAHRQWFYYAVLEVRSSLRVPRPRPA